MQKAVICDLDGTLALLNGRNPHNQEDCDKDLVNKPVLEILKMMENMCYHIIFITGRSESARNKTCEWLKKIGMQEPYEIYMRQDGDKTPSYKYKFNVYKNMIERRYDVKFVLDDKKENLEMFRSLGITSIEVRS